MSSDQEFINGMRTTMRSAAGELAEPPELLPTLRKRYARRVLGRRAGFAAVPLVIAVLVGVVVTAPGTGTAGGIQDVAYVTEQVGKALDSVDHDVVHVKVSETGPDGKYSSQGTSAEYNNWIRADGCSLRSFVTVDGTPVFDQSVGPDGGVTVDYRDRTWRRGTPNGARCGEGGYLTNVLTPRQIKEAMESGDLKITNRGEVVDGQATIELSGDKVMPVTGSIRFWVNESTYLPIRSAYGDDDGGWGDPADFTWLPPTPENMALLTPPIPEGFTLERP
jgi:hypothetical protein